MRHCYSCEGLREEAFSLASNGRPVPTCLGCGNAFPPDETAKPVAATTNVVALPVRAPQTSTDGLVQTARDRLATVETQLATLTAEAKMLRRIVKAAK
jgi:hypothetical protein